MPTRSTPNCTMIEALESRLLLTTTVTLDLQIDNTAHTFHLYADASMGDNAGIAGFDIPISNTSSARIDAPYGTDSTGQPLGFSIGRSSFNGELFAGQSTLDPNSLLLGIGQQAGSFQAMGGGTVSWAAHVLLADGTFAAGHVPMIDYANLLINLFGTPISTNIAPADSVVPTVQSVRMDEAVLYNAPPQLNYDAISPTELQTWYGFFFDAYLSSGASVTSASITTPDSTSYTLTKTQGATSQDWGFSLVDTQAALSHFTDGDYTLSITTAGGTITKTIAFNDSAPTQQPQLDSSLMWNWDVTTTPTLSWGLATDTAVTKINVELTDAQTGAVVDEALGLSPSITSWQPSGLSANKAYVVSLSFASQHTTPSGADVPVTDSKSTSTTAIFNTYTSNLLSPVTQVYIDQGVVTDSSSSAMNQFDFTAAGASSSLNAHFESPSGTWYALNQSTTGGVWYHAASTNASDLADFTDGTYTLWINRSDLGPDVYATTTFTFTGLTAPTQVPSLLTPAASATNVAVSPQFSWAAVTDSAVNGTNLIVYQDGSPSNDITQSLPTTTTSFQRAQPLAYNTLYDWQVSFSNSAQSHNSDGVGYLIDKYQAASASFTTAPRQVDLTGHLTTSTLPPLAVANHAITGTLGLVVTNLGNSAAITGQTMTITVLAPSAADPTHPVTLATLAGQSISGLAVGGTKNFSVPVNFTAGLAAGAYTIEALLSASGINDPNLANNLLTQNASGQPITMSVQTSYYDLTAALGAGLVMPWVAVSGAGNRLVVPVIVGNAGNATLPLGQKIDLTLSARPTSATDSSSDVLLKTLAGQSISLLAPHLSRTFILMATLPPGLADNHYYLVAKVDTRNQVPESNENNNEAVTAKSIDVIQGYVDLTGSFGLVTLPPAIVSGSTLLNKRATVKVTNIGTVPLPLGQTVNVTLLARPMAGGSDIQLAAANNQIFTALAAGTTRPVTIIFSVPSSLPAGTYELVAEITPNGGLVENNTSNNEVSLNALGQSIRLDSEASFVDLMPTLGASYLPASVVAGAGVHSTAQVIITNIGNTAMPVGQVADVILRARNEGDGSAVELGRYHNYPLSGLPVGLSRTVSIVVNPTGGLPAGAYHLEAQVVPANLPSEVTENDTTSVNAAGQQIDLVSATPFIDLKPAIGATALLPYRTIISGDGTRIVLPVAVRNIGNMAVSLGASVDIQVFAHPVSGGSDQLLTTLANQPISLLAANASRTFMPVVTLPMGLAANDYQLVAQLTPHNVTESDTTNDSAITSRSLHVARGFVDLAGTFSSVLLGAHITSGQRIAGSVRVSVTNLGRVALPAVQSVTLTLKARPSGGDGSTDIQLAQTLSLPVSRLAAGASRLLTIAVNDLAGLSPGTYTLVATINPVQPLTEESTANNVVTQTAAGVMPTITVV